MYRENFYDVIASTGQKINTVVIPKNSGLKAYVSGVLAESGLDLQDAVQTGKNKLVLKDLTFILKRGEDVPQVVCDYAARGVPVLGITGDDLYDEFRLREPTTCLKLENTYDWFDPSASYKRPALCFINKEGDMASVPLEARIAINKKYPLTSRDYLAKSAMLKGKTFKETSYAGDVELAVSDCAADCAIDIVYTGTTLSSNKLKVADIVRFSDIAVISPFGKEESSLAVALNTEYGKLKQRLEYPTGSFTSEMLKDIDKVTSKGAEEWGELVKAFKKQPDPDFVGEAADVTYVLMAMLVKRGVPLDSLAGEMSKRQK